MTATRAAKMLNVTSPGLYHMIKKHNLPEELARKKGHRWVIHEDAIDILRKREKKLKKETAKPVPARKPDCMYYRACLDRAAMVTQGKGELSCKGCSEYIQDNIMRY